VGGLLLQKRDLIGWEPNLLTFPTKARPTAEQLEDLRIAWLVAKHAKSNTIVLARTNESSHRCRPDEPRRVRPARHEARGQRGQRRRDGFRRLLPFPDNVDNAAEGGITSIVQPGGSKKDDEVIAAADKHGIAMVFTGKRHFRH